MPDFRKLKNNPQIEARDIKGNQWLSKFLFGALPYSPPDRRGQFYKLEIEQRADGEVYRPTRTDLNLESLGDIPPYSNDGYEHVLVEENGVLTWEIMGTGCGAGSGQIINCGRRIGSGGEIINSGRRV